MIHLDTNYLIGLPVKGSAVALDVDGWLAAGESFSAIAIAWKKLDIKKLKQAAAKGKLAKTTKNR